MKRSSNRVKTMGIIGQTITAANGHPNVNTNSNKNQLRNFGNIPRLYTNEKNNVNQHHQAIYSSFISQYC